MADTAPRVVVLSRDGAAGAKLQAAFTDAGADVVLVADPSDVDIARVLALAPYAVLVALDPVVEDALDRLGPLLADPDLIVMFEEADVVVQREGWDAARWSRHLAAKLHRHDDVLPPGGSDEEFDWQPSPGPLAAAPRAVDLDEAIAAFETEALARADDVPRDGGVAVFEPVVDDVVPTPGSETGDDGLPAFDVPAADAGPSPFDPVAAEAAASPFDPVAAEAADTVPVAYDTLDFDGTALETLEDDEEERIDVSVSLGGDDFAGITLDLDGDDADDLAAGLAEVAEHTSARGLPLDDGFDFNLDTVAVGSPLPVDEADAVVDVAKREFAFGLADADSAMASVEKPVFDASLGDGLSLADPDAVPATLAAAPARDTPDLAVLAEKASALSLADEDSYGHGPLRGAVLVEAGLGGPDAIRQLLAALPEGFARPVLIRMQLDGGRYDRLVQQMGRATSLPVALAEPSHLAEPGTVYFVPPGLGLGRKGAHLQFVADAVGDALAHLPPEDSAVLFLSGAEPALVPAAIARRGDGLLLASQTSEGCYDARAADAAAAGGARVDAPADLAARLLERWPA